MSRAGISPEVTVWTDGTRASVARQVLDLMGSAVTPIGVGGVRAREVKELAEQLQCARGDDLRKILVDRPATFVLLTTMEGVPWEAVEEAVKAGSLVLTMEPIDADLPLAGSRHRGPRSTAGPAGGAAVFVPSFKRCGGWTSAADPRQVLACPRLLRFSSYGTASTGSLFARLYDAWRMVLRFGPVPETVDASLAGPAVEVPDSLRLMSGHMAVHARIPARTGNCSAVVDVSDRAACVRRELRVIADEGHLQVTDDAYALHDTQGNRLDGHETSRASPGFADLITDQWRRMLDRPEAAATDPGEDDESKLVACCQASLLSARTGQPESPEKLLQAHGR